MLDKIASVVFLTFLLPTLAHKGEDIIDQLFTDEEKVLQTDLFTIELIAWQVNTTQITLEFLIYNQSTQVIDIEQIRKEIEILQTTDTEWTPLEIDLNWVKEQEDQQTAQELQPGEIMRLTLPYHLISKQMAFNLMTKDNEQMINLTSSGTKEVNILIEETIDVAISNDEIEYKITNRGVLFDAKEFHYYWQVTLHNIHSPWLIPQDELDEDMSVRSPFTMAASNKVTYFAIHPGNKPTFKTGFTWREPIAIGHSETFLITTPVADNMLPPKLYIGNDSLGINSLNYDNLDSFI